MRVNWKNQSLVEGAVKQSASYTDALDVLGLKPIGGNVSTLKKYIAIYNISISHMKPCESKARLNRRQSSLLIPLSKILDGEQPQYQTNHLKRRLLSEGVLPNKCVMCGQGPVWNDKPLVLQLDHIDGDNSNHVLKNLRILCGHCHSQTDTFAGRNKKN